MSGYILLQCFCLFNDALSTNVYTDITHSHDKVAQWSTEEDWSQTDHASAEMYSVDKNR